jgi:lambda repressor-like predicted transcriptional regulator
MLFNAQVMGAFMAQASSKNKLSVGTLRNTQKKTRPRSPDLIGNLHLQRHTFEAIAKEFKMNAREEVICNIAAWGYSDEGGRYLNVEISPPYKRTKTARPDILDSIVGDDPEQK